MSISFLAWFSFVASLVCSTRALLLSLGKGRSAIVRRYSLRLLIAGGFIGVVWIVAYSANNFAEVQLEIPGDASYFVSAADAIAHGVDVEATHSVYPAFLSLAFAFGDSGAWINRLLQLLLMLSALCAALCVLSTAGVTDHGLRFFFWACVTSAGFYSLSFVLVRDGLMLACVLWAALYLQRLARARPGVHPVGTLFDALCLSASVLLLFQLQPLLVALLVVAIAIVTIIRLMTADEINMTHVTLSVFVLLVAIAGLGYIDSQFDLARLVEVNFAERQRLIGDRDFVAIGAQEADETPFYQAVARFIFGPGVVRPLIPERFFPVSYPLTYNVAYFLAVVGWYGSLIYLVPKLHLAPRRLIRQPIVLALGIFAILFISSYALADAGQGGLRKRSIVYVLTWMIAAYGVFAPPVRQGRAQQQIQSVPGVSVVMRAALLFGLALVTIKSLE